ncbi:MAG: dTDP-4-dehydrorhamnose reductase [Gammaproteobacteria bacterium]|nr:dTDP-4-dehydrorhamnose reductase [Gammaproteobacteria bacterium]
MKVAEENQSLPVIMLTGANGQLGWETQRRAQQLTYSLRAFDRQSMDITDAAAVDAIVGRLRPQAIINAAAYTAVDRAEEEPELAHAVNRDGAANLARAARECGARLVHVSTDFVFDGAKGSPYLVDDAPAPRCVYGATKLAGEQAVLDVLTREALIVRAAWVYSSHGGNFVHTMLRLMASRDALRVVDDQIGSPTWAGGLADCIWRALEAKLTGKYHWTDAGVASWYDFAVAIQEEALTLGLLSREIPIEPIATGEYPLPARRPAYSVLDKSAIWQTLGYKAPHWRMSLRAMLKELDRA